LSVASLCYLSNNNSIYLLQFDELPERFSRLSSNVVAPLEDIPTNGEFQLLPDSRPAHQKDSFASSIWFPSISQGKIDRSLGFPHWRFEFSGPVYQPVVSLDGLEAHLKSLYINSNGPEILYPRLLA